MSLSALQEIEESIDLADEQERKRNEQLRRLADAVSKCGYVIQCHVPYQVLMMAIVSFMLLRYTRGATERLSENH